jgi:hypothetical protein
VKYFELENLRAVAPQPPRGSAGQQPPQTISAKSESLFDKVLNRMKSVEQNSDYSAVTDTWGFKALHAALEEASRPAEERIATVLQTQTEVLNKSLEQVSTGDGWRKHLEIDELQKLAQQKNISSDDQVEKIATKFERIARNPEYEAIVQLPGFQEVYSSLRSLDDGRETTSSAKREPSPPSEEKR